MDNQNKEIRLIRISASTEVELTSESEVFLPDTILDFWLSGYSKEAPPEVVEELKQFGDVELPTYITQLEKKEFAFWATDAMKSFLISLRLFDYVEIDGFVNTKGKHVETSSEYFEDRNLHLVKVLLSNEFSKRAQSTEGITKTILT
jgi:hypothetical protein